MRRFVASVLLVMLAACGGDSTGPNGDLTGSYTLRTVNGANVPAVLYQDSQEKDELTGGNINLNADKTWSGTLSTRVTDLTSGGVGTFSAPAGGTYSSSGGTITLTEAGGASQLTGSVSAGTLTISADLGLGAAITLVFKR